MPCRVWFVTASAALALSPALARAGVVYVEQTRFVLAETSHNDLPDQSDSESAADFGAFNGEAFSELHDDQDGDGANARVTQSSRLEAGGATATGSLRVGALGEFGRGRTLLDVGFDVTDVPQDFTLRYTLAGTGPVQGVTEAFRADIRLERLDADGATPVVDPALIELADPETSGSDTAADSDSGTLAPGRYRVLFDMRALSVVFEGSYSATYDFALEFADAGPGPTPIPLPPALWGALASSGALGAVRVLRRTRRRA
jgi:hypothetical protein